MKYSIRRSLFPGARFKAVTLSYDDGVIHDRRLVQILDLHGVKGTFHLNSGFLGHEGRLDAGEIATLFGNHEVSAHSVSHPHLQTLPPEQLAAEILEDRRSLEALVSYPVRGMSYPYGSYSDEVVKALPVLGIEYARTTRSHGCFDLPEDLLRWHPTCHHKQDLRQKTADFLALPHNGRPQLFYVWGHSYEFDRENNWELIEQFCEQLAGARESIWFATNIEIVDYLHALRNVRVSVDGHIVHNRSHLSVWLSVNNEPREMAPGEMLRLE